MKESINTQDIAANTADAKVAVGIKDAGERAYIPLSIPNFEGNEKKYVDEAIEQGWVSTGGAFITRLERSLADFMGIPNVAAVQSGTSALHLSLIEAGVKPGDVVLVSPVTFIAAVNPVRYQFATPVFIDCDDSFCMDPEKLANFCSTECAYSAEDGGLMYKGKRVKAVIVVHVFGNIADMERIMAIAEKYGLTVIEDATEALGTKYTQGRYAGKYAGTIGHFGAFSFNGNKIVTTGGGGAVTASRAEVVDHLRFLSTQAKTDPHYYIHDEIGYNYRMTNLQAALGVAQMEELPDFISRKTRNYRQYCDEFAGFDLGYMMPFRDGTASNHWFYSLCINRDRVKFTEMRKIITALDAKKIQTRPIWGLINEQKPYKTADTYKLEKAPYYAERILNLPSSTQITSEEISYVVKEVKALFGRLADQHSANSGS